MTDLLYFAREDGVRAGLSAAPDEIEITSSEYQAALVGMVTGKRVRIDGGFAVVDAPPEPEPATEPVPPSVQVDQERDRRMSVGFDFRGKRIQFRPGDRENIQGAFAATQMAKEQGAVDDDPAWLQTIDPSAPAVFAWITADNSLLALDLAGMTELGVTALLFKNSLVFKARAIKDRIANGETVDIGADATWA